MPQGTGDSWQGHSWSGILTPSRTSQSITCSAPFSGVSFCLPLNSSLDELSSWFQLAHSPRPTPQPHVLSVTLSSVLWAHWLMLSMINPGFLKESSSPSNSHVPWETSDCSSLAGLRLATLGSAMPRKRETSRCRIQPFHLQFEQWGLWMGYAPSQVAGVSWQRLRTPVQ